MRAKNNINDEVPEIPTWSSESEYFFIIEKEDLTFALLRLNPYICQKYTTVYYMTVYFHLNVERRARKLEL